MKPVLCIAVTGRAGRAAALLACIVLPAVLTTCTDLAEPPAPFLPGGSMADARADVALRPVKLSKLESPVRAVGTPSGHLLVTDTRLRMVVRVDPVTLVPDRGLRLNFEPSAVALAGHQVFVGNPARQTISVYHARSGAPLRDFGRGVVSHPTDIAVDAEAGLLFVVDGRARNVKVFSTEGDLQTTIGAPGPGPDQFLVPLGVAVDPQRREVYVSDYGSPPAVKASVKKFTYGGAYLDLISGAGRCGMLGCSGGFSRPQGLAVSADGTLFLADALLGRVLVINGATKAIERTLGSSPTLRVPSDVVLASNGDVLVVSSLTATIVAFRSAAAP